MVGNVGTRLKTPNRPHIQRQKGKRMADYRDGATWLASPYGMVNSQCTQQTERQASNEESKNCPFTHGMRASCKGERCAYFNEGCAILTGSKAVKGRKCPYNAYSCNDNCMMYENESCAFLARGKGEK